jgi:indole-3-glycerol phosphate synthase
MGDFLDILARDISKTLDKDYYNIEEVMLKSKISLKEAIEAQERNPVIAEIKTASPSLGIIRTILDYVEVAKLMESNGAVGISVLTEPKHFGGDINIIHEIRDSIEIPIMMKDIILDTRQVDAASNIRADAILLIKALFDRGYCNSDLDAMIRYAHKLGLEVLLETHTKEEFLSATQSEADLLGINNRNLSSLRVDLGVTENILKGKHACDKSIVSESGIRTPEDLRFLREKGARAFLIGSAIMQSEDIGEAVRRFVLA